MEYIDFFVLICLKNGKFVTFVFSYFVVVVVFLLLFLFFVLFELKLQYFKCSQSDFSNNSHQQPISPYPLLVPMHYR